MLDRMPDRMSEHMSDRMSLGGVTWWGSLEDSNLEFSSSSKRNKTGISGILPVELCFGLFLLAI